MKRAELEEYETLANLNYLCLEDLGVWCWIFIQDLGMRKFWIVMLNKTILFGARNSSLDIQT